MTATDITRCESLNPGTEVEVRNRFDGEWGVGFEIAAVDDHSVRVRRSRDGFILPAEFSWSEIRTPPLTDDMAHGTVRA